MIPQASLEEFNLTEKQVNDYLARCDEVFDLPNGCAVRRGSVVHILAPQKALSGRKLLRECRVRLNELHQNLDVIYANVKKDNTKAQDFALAAGFEVSHIDATHVWFAHRSMQ